MSRKGPYAPDRSLCHERVILEVVVLEDGIKGAFATPESQRVYGEHRGIRVGVITVVPGSSVFACEGFAQDHPECVSDGCVVAAGEHEPVGVWMLGSAVVISETAEVGPDEVRRYGVGRVGERSAEVSGLGVVAE